MKSYLKLLMLRRLKKGKIGAVSLDGDNMLNELSPFIVE